MTTYDSTPIIDYIPAILQPPCSPMAHCLLLANIRYASLPINIILHSIITLLPYCYFTICIKKPFYLRYYLNWIISTLIHFSLYYFTLLSGRGKFNFQQSTTPAFACIISKDASITTYDFNSTVINICFTNLVYHIAIVLKLDICNDTVVD